MEAFKLISIDLGVLSIPDEVLDASDSSEITISKAGISELPAPFNTATVWVACRQAWPHADPDFEGLMFITLAIKADHTYNQIAPGSQCESLGVSPGTLFPSNPLAFHWLQPSNLDDHAGFIGLQWEVPFDEFHQRYRQLHSELARLSDSHSLTISVFPTLLKPQGEYLGDEPGFFPVQKTNT